MKADDRTSSRPYEGDRDLTLLRGFLSALTAGGPPQSCWHPGDIVWTVFQNTRFDPYKNIRLWEDGEGLAGFAILEEPDGVIAQVRPALRGHLEERMLRWAAERLADPARNPGAEIWTRALDTDQSYVALLDRLGFRRDADHAVKMHRRLEGPIPKAPLSEGWKVRPVGGEDEWDQRVKLHREVWAPSRVTLAAYRRLRITPGYDPHLDLVAAGPDGGFGSYCICWLDPASKFGLFEPVGTHPAHRRKGLGRAVMLEGLRRLRELGAESALVTYTGGNEAAARLYESVGFEVVNREHLYGRKLEGFSA